MPRTRVPTQTTSAHDRAISPITSRRLARAKPALPALRAAPSCRPAAGAALPACSAGSTPLQNAVSSAAANASATTVPSMPKCNHNSVNSDSRSSACCQRRPAWASGSAMATAIRLSSRLCVNRCAIRRVRLAPSATRTASSCRRPSVRVSSRFAAFAQAISRTMNTATSIMPSIERVVRSMTMSLSGSTRGRRPRKRSGSACAALSNQAPNAVASSAAATPACRRSTIQ